MNGATSGKCRTAMSLLAFAALISSTARAQEVHSTPAGDVDLSLLRKAFDWQLALLPTQKIWSNDTPTQWIRVPFYDGGIAMYDATGDAHYLDGITAIADANKWELLHRTRKSSGLPGAWQLKDDAAKERYDRFADDLAIGQVYASLYGHKKDPVRIAALQQRLDGVLASEKLPGRVEWWWCDALYMAPPAYARLSAVTGDRKYLDYADTQFWDTTAFLYNEQSHLFSRDKSMLTKLSKNGQPLFWSRGNAWVMGGIANVLAAMPADYPSRPKYVKLLNEMAAELATLQGSEGFWPVSLLDPDAYPGRETSGTAFDCFAIAWGINNGVLDREKYLPVVRRAWAGLSTTIDPATGAVRWVQLVGSAPAAVEEADIAPYGTGALLLAATEILKLK